MHILFQIVKNGLISEEWVTINGLFRVLKPFEKATKAMSGEKIFYY